MVFHGLCREDEKRIREGASPSGKETEKEKPGICGHDGTGRDDGRAGMY